MKQNKGDLLLSKIASSIVSIPLLCWSLKWWQRLCTKWNIYENRLIELLTNRFYIFFYHKLERKQLWMEYELEFCTNQYFCLCVFFFVHIWTCTYLMSDAGVLQSIIGSFINISIFHAPCAFSDRIFFWFGTSEINQDQCYIYDSTIFPWHSCFMRCILIISL